ncbi:MAG: cytochrome c biogenesis protein ResB [Deltaproteobacteria bacterium]|nr:cytochrome c biogenesis protein ResB [Deltaproteobacteria bacterium]
MNQAGHNNTGFWGRPWSYAHGAVINLSLVFLGLIIEVLFAGKLLLRLVYPLNVYVLVGFVAITILLHFSLRQTEFLSNFCGVKHSLCIVALIGCLSLVGGILPQDDHVFPHLALFGLTHIFSSWPFLFIVCLLFIQLGLVILRHPRELSKKSIAFYCNHLGLWIVVAAMCFGAGDIQRFRIELEEGKYSWVGLDNNDQAYELPFAIKLDDFSLTEYAPEIVLVKQSENKQKIVGKNTILANKGATGKLDNFLVDVLEYYPSAVFFGGKYVEIASPMAVHAALLKITDLSTAIVTEEWVSTSGMGGIAKALELSSELKIGMLRPKPKEFLSKIEIITKDKEKFASLELRVNQPYRLKDWNIYQTSYDEEKGKWSTISVVEAIKDPWLPLVYLGMILMLIGATMIGLIRA